MMNNFESGALYLINQQSAADREREDGRSNTVRFMGRYPACIAAHLRLRYVLSLAIGWLTAPCSDDARQIR